MNPSYCDVLWPILNLSAVIAARNRHSLHSTYARDMRPACSATHMNHSISQRAGDVAMAYWSCDSLKVPGFVMRMSFVNGIFVYSVYGQTEFPFRKPFETEFTIFPNGKGNFLKRKIIIPTFVIKYLRISRMTDISFKKFIWFKLERYIFNSIIIVFQESEYIEFLESLGVVSSIQYIVHTCTPGERYTGGLGNSTPQ